MDLKKLNLLHKLRKEKLESILVDLKIQQELLEKYQQQVANLEQQKIYELETVSKNVDLGFIISNFLDHINKEINNKKIAISNCLSRIEIIEESLRESFQELKQVEIITTKISQQIIIANNKKEQLELDELTQGKEARS